MTHWSKIQHLPHVRNLKRKIRQNVSEYGLTYHNLNHLDHLYNYLAETRAPYDEALDYAVMFHDSVYDCKPEKEIRSADFCAEILHGLVDSKIIGEAQDMILDTIDHCVSLKTSHLIRADLSGLTRVFNTVTNYGLILMESKNLYCELTDKDFANASTEFMTGLAARMYKNIMIDPTYKQFYKDVLEGINLTIDMNESILQRRSTH